MNISLLPLALIQSALLAMGQVMLKLAVCLKRHLLCFCQPAMDVYHQKLSSEHSISVGKPKFCVWYDSCHDILSRTGGLV